MTMMISKFHKLIQSKVVWYIVLGVIVIAFVGFFTPTMGNKAAKTKENDMGELFGEKISQQEYRRALQNTHVWYILSSGRMPDMNPEMVEMLQQQAWERLAILHKAAAEKIIVSDQEVVQQIQRMPVFMNQDRVFDAAAYKAILSNIGISSKQLEQTAREQIAVYKLMSRPAQAALISSHELNRAYQIYTDRLVLDYAVIPRTQLEQGASVTREEAEAFFAQNIESFRIPARVRVSYVEYPVADFIAQAELPEDVALQVYNKNIEAYRVENEDELAPVEYKPFEDVEAEIIGQLKEVAARRLALEEATSLVAAIAPRSPTETPDFKGAAATAGLQIKTLPPFGPVGELKGIDPTAPFRQSALGLQADNYSSFSDAVVGKDSVYVLSLEQRYESFLPGFEAVEKEAIETARAQAASRLAATRTQEIRDAVSDALAAGTGFKDAVKLYDVDVKTTEEFDLTSRLEEDYAEQLIQASITVAQGQLAPVVPVEEGAMLVYVVQRTSVDAEVGMAAIRDRLINGLSDSRAQRLASDWRDELMKEADLQVYEK